MADEMIQCSNCKVRRAPDQFVGASGAVVRRCMNCRAKDVKNKSRPDKREKRNAHLRETRPDIKHREKMRAEDEAAYLQRNAEAMRKWRANNEEHVRNYVKMNVRSRVGGIEQQARKKGIEWGADMTREHCEVLVRSPCFYCCSSPETCLNGFDRMDSTSGYWAANCVPCCGACNFMKKSLDAKTFVERCLHISHRHGGPGHPVAEAWEDRCSRATFREYGARATKKGIVFEMTLDVFEDIASNPCHYCGARPSCSHVNGIDRKDNSAGYVPGNMVACCGECNHMKADMSDADFIAQSSEVAAHVAAAGIDVPPMPRQRRAILPRKGGGAHGTSSSDDGGDVPMWVLQHACAAAAAAGDPGADSA